MIDPTYPIEKIQRDFPNLAREVHGKRLVYLDNAATTLKPQVVIDAVNNYYASGAANIHRGVHYLSEEATRLYEDARREAKNFLGARDVKEIIFTSGTTAGINLVAQSYGRSKLKAGDEILITAMEHHSNIVPWQMLCEQTGAVLKVAPIDDRGDLIMDELYELISARTKLVAVVGVSNALGTVNPLEAIITRAHEVGAVVLVDAAQMVAHQPVDVAELDCDFLVFSSHKIYGPTGAGVLYGKKALLEAMPPILGGGDMIRSVSFEKTTYAGLPSKFEAGTPAIASFIGLGAALRYVRDLGLERIRAYEDGVVAYAAERLASEPGVTLVGEPKLRASAVSFVLDNVHPHDIGTILDQEGVAIRAGHHCAQPVMTRFGVPATARASVACYNTIEDIDALIRALRKAREMFL